jgi:hypothetical protein
MMPTPRIRYVINCGFNDTPELLTFGSRESDCGVASVAKLPILFTRQDRHRRLAPLAMTLSTTNSACSRSVSSQVPDADPAEKLPSGVYSTPASRQFLDVPLSPTTSQPAKPA